MCDQVTSCGLRSNALNIQTNIAGSRSRLGVTESKLPMFVPLGFGLESAFPRFVDVQSKRRMTSAFIYLCKLSDIMMAITVFTGDKTENMNDSLRAVSEPVMEIHRLRALDAQLMQGQSEFRRDLKQTNMQSLPWYSKMQLYNLDILRESE